MMVSAASAVMVAGLSCASRGVKVTVISSPILNVLPLTTKVELAAEAAPAVMVYAAEVTVPSP
ncbi:hypothetical protein Q2V44_22945, partial [Enterobacter asburiae]|nr:hypothetical protein [Enterobacter asburiae]